MEMRSLEEIDAMSINSLRYYASRCNSEIQSLRRRLAEADRLNLERQKRIEQLEAGRLPPAVEPPKFEVGKCYKTKGGEVVRLEEWHSEGFPFVSRVVVSRNSRHKVGSCNAYHHADGSTCDPGSAYDLIPGEVAPPVFEVGKCYRTRGGLITSPIAAGFRDGEICYKPSNDPKHTIYIRTDGAFHGPYIPDEYDLLPGEVEPPPTWTPPASLPDGDWQWDGATLHRTGKHGDFYSKAMASEAWRPYKDWTDPSKVGRWKVANGKAEWIGDA